MNCFKNKTNKGTKATMAGEMAQWLRVLAALFQGLRFDLRALVEHCP